MSKSMDLQKKLKLSTRYTNEEEKLPETGITHRKRGNYVSEINREPVPEDKIRETHAHRGTSIVERGSGNARHRAQGGGGALEHFTDETCPPDRRRSTSRERKEKKKDRRKDSRNRRTYLPAEDETVTSVVHGN